MADVVFKVLLDRGPDIDPAAVESELAANGFVVEECLPDFGMILGTASDDSGPALLAIHGVVAVEAECGVELPPMNEDVPQ